ncbi:MAG: ATP-dependent zinc metalloprotease FtsH [Candidatus Kerfeldbacteria bacterium]|nr:ATP-dependent zinc metalloprotease FtsH [Candidatus Kerfeldbacteria bacterium]
MKNVFRSFTLFFLAFLVLASILSVLNGPSKAPEKVDLSTLIADIEDQRVESVIVDGDILRATRKDGTVLLTTKEATESFSELMRNYAVTPDDARAVKVTVKDRGSTAFWIGTVLPIVLPILIIGAIFYFLMRQVQGSSNRALMFGQSRAREIPARQGRNRITFKDVAGIEESKEELKEVVQFLQQPKKFLSLGAKIPKGVLLVGAPGTGKTLLARAVAGEANVPFFHISGSEFVEMFVGVGASRVRDLFRKAKRHAPCIIFIDEIDAVGRQRGTGLGGSHDEREQTLNQILVEMDGFDTSTNVIIIAATNRPDVLDQALLRPGRFDRRVVIDLPDIKDREAILGVHAKQKPLAADVSLHEVAVRTPGFSGADLANLLNEAAILAARRNLKQIRQTECLESIEKVMLGPERKSRVFSPKEKEITAFHEAGHALVSHVLPHADPVRKVSIISRGMAGGYTLKLPTEDKHYRSRAEFEDNLAVMLAGHAAEKEVFKEITTGAANDLREATKLAKRLVTEYGMSDKLGPRTFGDRQEMIFLGREIHEQRDYGEEIASLIDHEVNAFISTAYRTAQLTIRKMRPKLEAIARRLIEQETLEQQEFEALVGHA